MPMALAMPTTSPLPDPLVRLLLDYLARHPQAADSLAGVARWWVGEDSPYGLEQVRAALARLVDHGLLRHERLADGTDWYAAVPLRDRDGHTLH